MSLEQLKAFLGKVKDDIGLQEKLKAAKSTDEVVAIAKDHGHSFSDVHLTELNKEDLEALSGGKGMCTGVSTWCEGTQKLGL